MDGHERLPPPRGYNPDTDGVSQNLSLNATYREFIQQAQQQETASITKTYVEAWRTCLEELPEACERRGLDAAYDLAMINRGLRSWRPNICREAGEALEALFDLMADEDMEFAFLYERCEDLEEEMASLDERHAAERRNAGIKPPRFFPDKTLSYLLGRVIAVLPERSD